MIVKDNCNETIISHNKTNMFMNYRKKESKSIKTLTHMFIKLIAMLDTNNYLDFLVLKRFFKVPQRRIYDIINILCGIGLVMKDKSNKDRIYLNSMIPVIQDENILDNTIKTTEYHNIIRPRCPDMKREVLLRKNAEQNKYLSETIEILERQVSEQDQIIASLQEQEKEIKYSVEGKLFLYLDTTEIKSKFESEHLIIVQVNKNNLISMPVKYSDVSKFFVTEPEYKLTIKSEDCIVVNNITNFDEWLENSSKIKNLGASLEALILKYKEPTYDISTYISEELTNTMLNSHNYDINDIFENSYDPIEEDQFAFL